MTATPSILGPAFDAPAKLAADLYLYSGKREVVRAALERAEKAHDAESAQLLWWELGLMDLHLVPVPGGTPYNGGSYEKYAEFYHFTPETVQYARERASETQDLILKLHYLEFVLLRTPPTGRAWIELQNEILQTYRQYVEACRVDKEDHFVGIYIERGITRIGQLLRRRGLIPPGDFPAWAEWIVKLAEDSRAFPVEGPAWIAQQRHRWVADYLRTLTAIPADAGTEPLRTRALSMISEAAAYYQTTPLDDYFESFVAEVEAELRKHWGEADTHERMIRKQFEVTLRRAEFHRSTGEGLITAIFFRRARALVERERQYFTDDDVARLERAEQESLERGVARGEFKRMSFTIEVPKELMDYVRVTPEATVQAILAEANASIPDRARMLTDVRAANARAPLQAILPRTVVGSGKVVGESGGQESNETLDVEQRAMLMTRLLGTGVADAVLKAAKEIGLSPDHLVAPLAPLRLDQGSLAIIHHGCERLIAGDSVSATPSGLKTHFANT